MQRRDSAAAPRRLARQRYHYSCAAASLSSPSFLSSSAEAELIRLFTRRRRPPHPQTRRFGLWKVWEIDPGILRMVFLLFNLNFTASFGSILHILVS
jgi:hypothetical protein